MDNKEIIDIVKHYKHKEHYKKMDKFLSYYYAQNDDFMQKWLSKERRNVTPNWDITSAYYKTVIDSMAGYMFQEVDYVTENDQYNKSLEEVLKANDDDVKVMETAVYTLATNQGVELVYTRGGGNGQIGEVRYVSLDPRKVVLKYDDSIEPELEAGLYIRMKDGKRESYYVDTIEKDAWRKYEYEQGSLVLLDEITYDIPLPFVPLAVYRADFNDHFPPFAQVIKYIAALDALLADNSNDMDKLAEAILVLGRELTDKDLTHLKEWKTLEGMAPDEKAEYITKDASPEFRQYVTELLIEEIHKHAHVVNWYADETGSGPESAKAMRQKLFDQYMFSKRIEKVFKKGHQDRMRMLDFYIRVNTGQSEEVDIVYNRVMPDETLDRMVAVNQVTFLSDETKQEFSGFDTAREAKRLQDQIDRMVEIDIEE